MRKGKTPTSDGVPVGREWRAIQRVGACADSLMEPGVGGGTAQSRPVFFDEQPQADVRSADTPPDRLNPGGCSRPGW